MSSGLRIVVFYSYLENSEIGVYQSPFKNLSQFFIFSLKNCGFFFFWQLFGPDCHVIPLCLSPSRCFIVQLC